MFRSIDSDKEFILSKVTDYQIFKYYFPDYEPGSGATNSPLRVDNSPSFTVFRTEEGFLLYHDFSRKDTGDCFIFVQKLLSYRKGVKIDYSTALDTIIEDFALIQDNNATGSFKKPKKHKINKDKSTGTKYSVEVKVKEYTKSDLTFWEEYGITLTTLKKFHVFAVSIIYINGNPIYCNTRTYGFLEAKDGRYSWKIYQPFNTEHKWINSNDKSVWQCWKQLPQTGNLLVITKSRKDIMALYEAGYISTGLQNEGIIPKPQVIQELKQRFKQIILLYDNDEQGIKSSTEISEKYNIPRIQIPEGIYGNTGEMVKDYSDLVKAIGKQESELLIKELINETHNK